MAFPNQTEQQSPIGVVLCLIYLGMMAYVYMKFLLELARSLALSLEFLLAADIAATAVSPDWNAVGKLAVIAFIRTFLNYFLEKDVEELQKIA